MESLDKNTTTISSEKTPKMSSFDKKTLSFTKNEKNRLIENIKSHNLWDYEKQTILSGKTRFIEKECISVDPIISSVLINLKIDKESEGYKDLDLFYDLNQDQIRYYQKFFKNLIDHMIFKEEYSKELVFSYIDKASEKTLPTEQKEKLCDMLIKCMCVNGDNEKETKKLKPSNIITNDYFSILCNKNIKNKTYKEKEKNNLTKYLEELKIETLFPLKKIFNNSSKICFKQALESIKSYTSKRFNLIETKAELKNKLDEKIEEICDKDFFKILSNFEESIESGYNIRSRSILDTKIIKKYKCKEDIEEYINKQCKEYKNTDKNLLKYILENKITEEEYNDYVDYNNKKYKYEHAKEIPFFTFANKKTPMSIRFGHSTESNGISKYVIINNKEEKTICVNLQINVKKYSNLKIKNHNNFKKIEFISFNNLPENIKKVVFERKSTNPKSVWIKYLDKKDNKYKYGELTSLQVVRKNNEYFIEIPHNLFMSNIGNNIRSFYPKTRKRIDSGTNIFVSYLEFIKNKKDSQFNHRMMSCDLASREGIFYFSISNISRHQVSKDKSLTFNLLGTDEKFYWNEIEKGVIQLKGDEIEFPSLLYNIKNEMYCLNGIMNNVIYSVKEQKKDLKEYFEKIIDKNKKHHLLNNLEILEIIQEFIDSEEFYDEENIIKLHRKIESKANLCFKLWNKIVYNPTKENVSNFCDKFESFINESNYFKMFKYKDNLSLEYINYLIDCKNLLSRWSKHSRHIKKINDKNIICRKNNKLTNKKLQTLITNKIKMRNNRGIDLLCKKAIENKCDIVVLENLTNFKTSSEKTRKENKWLSNAKVQDVLDKSCYMLSKYGIQCGIVDPEYTSKLIRLKNGEYTVGVRMCENTEKNYNKQYVNKEIKKYNFENNKYIPVDGGNLIGYIDDEDDENLKICHADENAAKNIGLFFLEGSPIYKADKQGDDKHTILYNKRSKDNNKENSNIKSKDIIKHKDKKFKLNEEYNKEKEKVFYDFRSKEYKKIWFHIRNERDKIIKTKLSKEYKDYEVKKISEMICV